ncbi:Replication factor 4, RFC4 [Carpediemonas membranifera]|uniref:Replication factor 4, RFC4 n=1 Tax=Carpediemonas membranifera TaxID=201153 RepID=A0A8J6B7V9_9EUKA|nr:Replication factor 4, RFC4 [Carpediemonas membranifera]|eukprot:KAG9397443.1 Replication factor 4, RFC4 [Carpediemonas membranifera]
MSSAKTEVPWTEKYRPKDIESVAHHEAVTKMLRNAIETGDMPHLLFHGTPGTGKTSTILALCRDLYGPKQMKKRVLFLNASDDRGIDVIRTRVKEFARIVVTTKVEGYPCPDYKFVILDEADNITPDAQSALRRTMETCSKNTRICLICNYVSRIIDPIKSRCAKFRFQPIPAAASLNTLRKIARKESLNTIDGTLERIVSTSGGDLRKAITTMQTAFTAFEMPGPADIDTLVGRIPDELVGQVYRTISSGQFDAAKRQADELTKLAYSVKQLMLQMNEVIFDDMLLSDQAKAAILGRMALVDRNIQDGALESLQLLDLLAFIGYSVQMDRGRK